MASIAFALPILPSKMEELKRLADDLSGSHQTDKQDQLRRCGADRENWYLQQTRQGDMNIVYLEGADIGRTFAAFITSDNTFDRWLKEQILAIHGIDFNQPLPGPIAQMILEAQAG
jgi:hypothetical protein